MSIEKEAASDQTGKELTQRRSSKIANPAPAGFFSFAATTFLISLYNINTRGIHTPNVVVGMALFIGGLLQILVGMWEFPRGNVFGATAFASYGCFWLSYAAILIPGSGIITAYSDPRELSNAIGLYLVVWFMFTVMLIPAVVRRNFSLTLLFTLLATSYIVLAAAELQNKPNLTKGAGVVGIITALVAYYIAISELVAAEDRPVVRIPQGLW